MHVYWSGTCILVGCMHTGCVHCSDWIGLDAVDVGAVGLLCSLLAAACLGMYFVDVWRLHACVYAPDLALAWILHLRLH